MAGSGNKKRVIILDENKKGDAPVDEEAIAGLMDEIGRELKEEGDISPEERIGEDEGPKEAEEADAVRGADKTGKRRRISRMNRLRIVLIVSVAVLVCVIIAALRYVGNNYETPVKVYEEYLNKPSYDGEELSRALGNGVADKELAGLRTILKASDEYMDSLNRSVLKSEEIYHDNCDRYGDDFKYTVSIEGMKPLKENELRACEATLAGIVNDIGNSSLARSESAELTLAVTGLTAELEHARITRGYRLYCTQHVSGSMEDGPISAVENVNVTVVKLNGRWIMWDKIYEILRLSY